MGRIVHLDKVREFIAKTPAFRSRDIELIVKDRGYTSLLLHTMERRGEIKRIVKGFYSKSDDPVVTVFAFKPSYIGLQEALSLRQIWEQETNVVLVTPLKVKPGLREIMGSSVVLHRIKKEYFFGFDYLRYGEIYLPVSDREKTLLDFVYFNETPGTDVLKLMVEGIERVKLREYLSHYPERLRRRVHQVMG